MFTPHDYQLLDFGNGRRLERFGDFLLDRPCPAVERVRKADPKVWDKADAAFDEGGGQEGRWFFSRRNLPETWSIAHGSVRFELKGTPQGQVGLFPEQAENWDWLSKVPGLPKNSSDQGARLKVLNLFAYTGGSTLAAALSGAEVTHIDAAKNVVEWARRNADLSGMTDAPIRWIAEDAYKFVKREIKRGNTYDAVILDPPSYGHGPQGEVWQLAKHLPFLLERCAELTAGRCRFVLLSCHTPGFEADRLSDMLTEYFPLDSTVSLLAQPLLLRTSEGREMPSGAMVRWTKPCG